VIPGDHARERVIAVGLRVKCVIFLEKGPLGKRDWFEIFLIKHFKQDFYLGLNLLIDKNDIQ